MTETISWSTHFTSTAVHECLSAQAGLQQGSRGRNFKSSRFDVSL